MIPITVLRSLLIILYIHQWATFRSNIFSRNFLATLDMQQKSSEKLSDEKSEEKTLLVGCVSGRLVEQPCCVKQILYKFNLFCTGTGKAYFKVIFRVVYL